MTCRFHVLVLAVLPAGSVLGADDAVAPVSGPVIVSATRFTQPLAEMPPYAQVITRRQIELSPARTVPELLVRLGNVSSQDLFGNNSTSTKVDLGSFGSAAEQNTLILVDGRRVTDVDLSGVNWSAIPLSAVERVEILRGGGAVLYGDGASAGVVNIITCSPGAEGDTAKVSAGAASHRTWRVQAEAAVGAGPVGLGVLANRYDSEGYRENNRNQQSVVQGDIRVTRPDFGVRLNVIGDHQRLRLPGARLVNLDT
ncbi:MAG: TonB-dependent receptor, partial [Betaproteobacteria bacterium]|nr:TonB-dependent receptor [Betaproteobacteria bacterium]